ncbi:MAG: UDP-N-acetylmuramate dehydrogenase [Bacteroidota bacterium]
MIQTNFDLTTFNTFGVKSIAEQYLYLQNPEQLAALKGLAPVLTLGSGSNLLLLEKVPGLCLHVGLGGIEYLSSSKPSPTKQWGYFNGPEYLVRVGAGVNWQQFVMYALERGWNGLENLALIPGTVGAAPVQNIGAYGVEISERIKAVHVYEYGYGKRVLSAEECDFSYRNSLFKKVPGKYLILAVDFRLGGNYEPAINYGAIRKKLSALGFDEQLSPRKIARAVMEIRASKLPFYSQLGNSGSFFKNPVVSVVEYEKLKESYPDLPAYPTSSPDQVKVPAGWLIDRAGWKGKRIGAVGCYENQALVIVNHGGASGQDILAFSQLVQADVVRQFKIQLEREVQVIGTV